MSKPPEATRAELVEAKVIREEDFALEAWRARVPFPEMRRRALAGMGTTRLAILGSPWGVPLTHSELTSRLQEEAS